MIKRLSIKVTLKSLLLLASLKKPSKPDEWLQNKWCSFMVEPLSPFTLSLVKVFTHFHFKIALSFAIIGSIAATTLEFVSNARKFENRNFIYESEKFNKLALSLLCNSKMAVGQLIFHYRLILVRIWSGSLSKFGSTIIKSFLSTTLTIIFGFNTLFKNAFIHLSTKSSG